MALLINYKINGEQTVREALASTAMDAIHVWEKARIQTTLKKDVINKLNVMYDEWIKLKINEEDKKKQSQNVLNKQAEWMKELDNLFDIAHANSLSLIDIIEDKEFRILVSLKQLPKTEPKMKPS